MENNTAVIGTPEQALWKGIQEKAKKTILEMTAEIEINLNILKMSEEKLKDLLEVELD